MWLPSLVEARYAHTERLTDAVLRYSNHFVALAQFFANTCGFGPSVPGDQDGMPFTLGWPQLIIAAIGAIAIARSDSGRWKQWAAFFGASAFVLCFLMTERAHELWDAVPQLHYVAFPWRLLASVAFCVALLASAIVLALPGLPERWQRWTYAAAIGSIVLIGLPRAQPQSYLSLDPLQWTPREIARRGAVAAAIFEAFEPRWVVERPVWNGGAIRVARGNAAASVYDRDPMTIAATVRAGTDWSSSCRSRTFRAGECASTESRCRTRRHRRPAASGSWSAPGPSRRSALRAHADPVGRRRHERSRGVRLRGVCSRCSPRGWRQRLASARAARLPKRPSCTGSTASRTAAGCGPDRPRRRRSSVLRTKASIVPRVQAVPHVHR